MAFNFDKKIKKFQALKRNLPAQIGNMAKNHFVNSFRVQGFDDEGVDPWQVRTTKDKSDRRESTSRAILVKTGHLRRSIRVRVATFSNIEVGSYGVPYAKYHNSVDAKIRRRFVARSRSLTRKIQRKINRDIKSVMI